MDHHRTPEDHTRLEQIVARIDRLEALADTQVSVTAEEVEALGYAVDMFELRAEECAERQTKGGAAAGTADLIHFYKGVAATLTGLRARCGVTS